jgi:two-component sensor histidine kinase
LNEEGLPKGAAEKKMKQAKKSASKKQRLPQSWTEKRIRELAAYHDNLSEEEQAAEIEAALDRSNRAG